jgi:nucleoside-diphosphate-sugar epimerase
MKLALITGAAGFIGGYTVEEFVQQGWHVLALIHRNTSPSLEALEAQGSVTIVRGDTTNYSCLEKLLNDAKGRVEVIVHCAGRASDVGRRREFERLNLQSVKHLVALTNDKNIDRLVFVSTTDVYGMCDFSGENEETLPLKNNTGNPYPEFKIAAEEWIREKLPPQQYSIIRPAAVWGVGDPTLTPRIVDFLRHSPWIIHFGKWRGGNRWPLAHVRNVSTALYLVATMSEATGRAINVLDSETTSVDEFYRMLAGIYLPEKTLRSITLPMWMGKLMGVTVSFISNLLNLNRPFTDPSLYAVHSVSSNLDFSNQAFLQLLGNANMEIVTREEGLFELVMKTGGD